MTGLVEVAGGVAAGRVIAAPNVTALCAEPEVDPATTGRQALLTTPRRVGLVDLQVGCDVGAGAIAHAYRLYATIEVRR